MQRRPTSTHFANPGAPCKASVCIYHFEQGWCHFGDHCNRCHHPSHEGADVERAMEKYLHPRRLQPRSPDAVDPSHDHVDQGRGPPPAAASASPPPSSSASESSFTPAIAIPAASSSASPPPSASPSFAPASTPSPGGWIAAGRATFMAPVILPSPTAEILRDRRLSLPSEHPQASSGGAPATSPPNPSQGQGSALAAEATTVAAAPVAVDSSPPIPSQGQGSTAAAEATAVAAATAAVAASTQRAIRNAEQSRANEVAAHTQRAIRSAEQKARAKDAAPSSSFVGSGPLTAAETGAGRDERLASVPVGGPVQFVISPMVLDIIVAQVVSNVRAGIVRPKNLTVTVPHYARSGAISVVPPVVDATAAAAASRGPAAGPAAGNAPPAPTLAADPTAAAAAPAPDATQAAQNKPVAGGAPRASPEPSGGKAQAPLKQAPRPLPLHPSDVGATTTRTRRSFAQVAAGGRTNEKMF